jgi:hypothetical protein
VGIKDVVQTGKSKFMETWRQEPIEIKDRLFCIPFHNQEVELGEEDDKKSP